MSIFSTRRPLIDLAGSPPGRLVVPDKAGTAAYDLDVVPTDADGNLLYGARVEVAAPGTERYATLQAGDAAVTLRLRGPMGPDGDPYVSGVVRVWHLGRVAGHLDLGEAYHRGDVEYLGRANGGPAFAVTVGTNTTVAPAAETAPPPVPEVFGERAAGGRAHLTWQGEVAAAAGGREDVSYRVFVGYAADALEEIGHTWNARVVVEDVDPERTLYFAVVAEDSAGRRSAAAAATLAPASETPLPSAARVRGLSATDVAEGATGTTSWHDALVFFGDAATADVDLVVLGIEGVSADVTVVAGADGNLSFTPNAAGAVVVALVRAKLPGKAPVWVAAVGGDGAGTARSIGGLHADHLSGPLTFDAEALAGPGTTVAVLGHAGRQAHDLPASVTASEVELRPRGRALPEVALLSGTYGYAAVVVQSEPVALALDLALLPDGFDRFEGEVVSNVGAGFEAVDLGFATYDSLYGKAWSRVYDAQGGALTSLYDVGPRHGPRPVYFAGPVHYGGTWFDAGLYPDDARMTEATGDARTVTYRCGLETASAAPALPTVASFSVVGRLVRGRPALQAAWDLRHPTEPSVRLDAAVPVFVADGSSNEAIARGSGSAVVEGLASQTTYTLHLFSPSGPAATGSTPRALPGLTVTARAVAGVAEDGAASTSYAYTYALEEPAGDPWASWTPALTGTAETEALVTLVSDEAVGRHAVRVRWNDDETVLVAADTVWRRPHGVVAFEEDVILGHRLVPAKASGDLRFRRRWYAGSRTKTYPTNLYRRSGTYRIDLVGALPPGMDGTLGDWAQATWVGPGGNELGAAVTIEAPTELAVRITVRADGGQSPRIYGFVPVRTRLTGR